MSQCFRTISYKFPPFIGTKKQVSQFSRQLPKHIKCSSFLEEFLGSRNVLNSLTLRDVSNEIVLPYLSFKNQIFSSLDTPKNSLISLRENVRKDVRIAKYKDTRRHHLPDVEPIDLFEENWKSTHKFSKTTQKQHKDGNEILFKKFPITNEDYITEIISPVEKNSGIVFMSQGTNLQAECQNNVSNTNQKASKEQLEVIFQQLKKDLPLIFVKTLNYKIYDNNFIFENNIRGTRTTGIFSYVKQIALLRTLAHMKYAYVKLEMLKMTIHPEDNSIKLRWRIVGLPGYKIFMFWKFNVFKLKNSVEEFVKGQVAWYDGFSTFYVGPKGKIVKHVADKMMPDQENMSEKKNERNPIAAKLTLFMGVKNIKQLLPDITNPFSTICKSLIQSERKWTHFEKIAFKMK